MHIKSPGHMTKMAAMPIYSKNPSKIFFSRTGGSISTKLGMNHRWLKHYNVYINHDLAMTLTYFMARSHWLLHVKSETMDFLNTIAACGRSKQPMD